MTKPLDPQRLRVRQMIKDARAAGRELDRIWVHTDGRVEIGFKDADAEQERQESKREGDTWADVA